MFPSCHHYISSVPLQTDVHMFLGSHWHSPEMMSHIHGHKQECCPPFLSVCLLFFRPFADPVLVETSSADLLFLNANLDLQTTSSFSCQPRSTALTSNIKSFVFSDVSPQWLNAARVHMLCLVSAAWPAEPVGVGVSVLGCSWSRDTVTGACGGGGGSSEGPVAGGGACPVPATRRWTNWTSTTTKPCRTAAVFVSFCPMMTRSML